MSEETSLGDRSQELGGAAQPLTVKQIVSDWLKGNGFDGLWINDCGCSVDDLAPCNLDCIFGDVMECRPGYVDADGMIRPTKAEAGQ